MKCIKCGKKIDDDSVFCKFCGKKQTTVEKKIISQHGDGSVTFRKDRNKWQARVYTPYGKRQHIGYFNTEMEAWREVKKFNDQPAADSYNKTVTQIYDEWKKAHFQTITKNGIQGYTNAWRYFDKISKLKMRDIKTSHIQSCIDQASEIYGRSVCEKIKSLAMQLCKYAMQEDLINKNYAEFLQLPSAEKPDTRPFTDDEIRKLILHDNDRVCRIILCMIFTGFRPTEFFSLEVKNIDVEKMFIRGGAKTEAGKNRIVPIHEGIQRYFKDFYDEAVYDGRKYLFVNQRGNKIDVNNFRNRYFYKTLLKIGVLKNENDKHVTPYSTRHTFATLCDRAEIDDDLIIKMIGHTSKKTTQIYIHKTEKDMQEALNKIPKLSI